MQKWAARARHCSDGGAINHDNRNLSHPVRDDTTYRRIACAFSRLQHRQRFVGTSRGDAKPSEINRDGRNDVGRNVDFNRPRKTLRRRYANRVGNRSEIRMRKNAPMFNSLVCQSNRDLAIRDVFRSRVLARGRYCVVYLKHSADRRLNGTCPVKFHPCFMARYGSDQPSLIH